MKSIHVYFDLRDVHTRGGAHLKKLRRAEGGTKICGVFRVKNHDFTPKKKNISSNFRARHDIVEKLLSWR
jgi:hypothetical protein